MANLDFEQTLQHLHSWLGQSVRVSVAPTFEGAVQAAVLGGTLARAEQQSSEVSTALIGSAGSDDLLFFFVEREDDDRRDSFVLTRAFFEYSFTQPAIAGGEMLVIMLRGISTTVRLMPH